MQDATELLIERDLEILSRARHYLSFQFEKIRPYIGSRIIEIGSGTGNHTGKIISSFSPEIFISIEKDRVFCNLLADTYGSRITILNADLTRLPDYKSDIYPKQIDTIIAINVIEHIKEDFNCLKQLREILCPGGNIILIVPALNILYSKLDKMYGHHRRYTKKMFQDYSEKLNLELLENSYFNFIGVFPWLIFNKLGQARNLNRKGMEFFDRVLPFSLKIEQKFNKVPLGLSLLGVFKK